MLPIGEKIAETKKCRLTGREFVVTDKDLEFYDKISPIFSGKKYNIPSPNLCPEERQRRRLMFRNERKLYKRKCNKTNKDVISIYSPEKEYIIYDQKIWWGDEWSAIDYGVNIDFSRRFFEQLGSLLVQVPKIVLNNKNAENSEYCHPAIDSKNCYLCSSSSNIENCLYCNQINNCKDCLDSSVISDSELCFECVDVFFSYGLSFCQNCNHCQSSQYLIDCENCSECFCCVGLSKKQYYILNHPFSPEKYRELLLDIKNNQTKKSEILSALQKLNESSMHKESFIYKSENCLGNYIHASKNCFQSFEINSSENVKYSSVIRRNGKEVYDVDALIDSELCLEQVSTIGSYGSAFNVSLWYGSQSFFSDSCNNTNDIFGCVGLKKGSHCILNKPYSVSEYESLCGKIIDHMISTGEWGEFFPHELSPFGYNETVAQEYFPLTEEAVKSRGWNWHEEDMKSFTRDSIVQLPIGQYDEKLVGFEQAQKNIDTLLSGLIKCEVTGKPFKIIKQELAFYIEHSLLIPTKHPDQRHTERMKMRNPRTLYESTCSECHTDIITTYSPDRPERVVCKKCYRKLVY